MQNYPRKGAEGREFLAETLSGAGLEHLAGCPSWMYLELGCGWPTANLAHIQTKEIPTTLRLAQRDSE